jgi:signal transduction histidine kinase
MRASGRMSVLIDDLLSFSRINNTEDKFELTDLSVLLSDVLDDMEMIMQEKKATVEFSGLPEVNVVRFQFRQLFSNLISNALKFSRKDEAPCLIVKHEIVMGMIAGEILTVNNKIYHHITFSDNGIGFDPEYNEKIFEMFHRLHGRTEFEGTGLGLSICKKIIENHNGIIRARGVPGCGATFHIYLPTCGFDKILY